MTLSKKNRTITILILGLLSALGPFSIDMYLPGFPVIAADLHTTIEQVAYSLSSFFIGISLGQLIYGPLLDRFGRKRPLYAGLVVYILASIGCALAPTIEVLIVFRLFQALGGCVGMVAPRAMVRDVFPLKENAKIFSLLILILGISPIIAPTAGSYVIGAFGWSHVFTVLTMVSTLILLVVIYWLPESRQPDPSFSLRPKAIISSFVIVIREPQFYTYALAGGISSAGLFAYLAGSPFVFMELFHATEQQYGMVFGLIAAGLITCSQLNTLLLRKFTSVQIINVVLFLQTMVGISLLAGTLLSDLGLYSTIFLIFLFLSCQGFNFPNSSALSMAPFTREAGSASALMGALQMGFGSLASALVGITSDGTAVPMAGIMAGCAFIGFVILMLGHRRIRFKAKERDIEAQALDMIEKY